jgi:glucosyl-3-phosphoglycerate synthase
MLATRHHAEFPVATLAAGRRRTVSVCVPARNEATTIGAIVDVLVGLRDAGVVDQVVVVDDSTDDTAQIASRRGADVYRQSALMASFGPVRGKGDAMWRALSVLTGDVVCFVDGDSEDFGAHFVCGLVGPLLAEDGPARFVKGFYRRPLRIGDTRLPEGGGRVTELVARPLLMQFFPELSHVRQPLAGEIAAERALLEELAFTCGYGVDIGLLIDAWSVAGLNGLAQVDLDQRQNRHQPLGALGPMAQAVMAAVFDRAGIASPELVGPPRAPVVRPPMASLAELETAA